MDSQTPNGKDGTTLSSTIPLADRTKLVAAVSGYRIERFTKPKKKEHAVAEKTTTKMRYAASGCSSRWRSLTTIGYARIKIIPKPANAATDDTASMLLF